MAFMKPKGLTQSFCVITGVMNYVEKQRTMNVIFSVDC